MLKKKSSAPNIDGKHNMTGLELSEADDLATMMTVDAVLGITSHKMDKNFNPLSIDKKVKERWKSIMEEFIADSNYENTYQQLIANEKVKAHWKKDERFRRHIFRFLYLFDKRSGIEIRPCFRYENEGKVGAGIYATKEWDKGCQITTLFGCIAEIKNKDEEYFREHKNEFSVMYSTRKNCSQLWLGPAAYVNHDCKPNCRFTEGNDDTKMLLETLRDIQPGDELVIFYGQSFFGPDNAECECFTCELRGRGYFSRNFEMNMSSDMNNNISNCDNLEVNCELNGKLNGIMSNQLHSPRRIITRSSGRCSTAQKGNSLLKDKNQMDNSVRKSDQRPLQTSINNWKKANNAKYSFRVTYSRIDRVKKSILTLKESEKSVISQNDNNNTNRNGVSNGLKRKANLETSISNRVIGTRSSSIKDAKCPKLHFSVTTKTDINYSSDKDNSDCIVIESNPAPDKPDSDNKDNNNSIIQLDNISKNQPSNPRRKSMRQKEKPKRYQNEAAYSISNDNINNKDASSFSPAKLKLIFRKNDKNGGKYGILNTDNEYNSDGMKTGADRNIFNCINTEYFLDEPPPKLKLSLSPKPPSLSPWFCTLNPTNANPNNSLKSNNKLPNSDDNTRSTKYKRLRRSSSSSSSLNPSSNFKKYNHHPKVFRKPPVLQENHIEEDDESIGDDPPQILKIINLSTQPIIVDSSSNSSSTSSCLLASYKSEESNSQTKSIDNYKKKRSKSKASSYTNSIKCKSIDTNTDINVQRPPILLQEESSSSIEASSVIMPFIDSTKVSRNYSNNSSGTNRITPPPKLFSQVDYNDDDNGDDVSRNIISPTNDNISNNTHNRGIRLKISRLKGSNKFTTLMTPPQ